MEKHQLHGVLYKVANVFLYAVITVANKVVLNKTGTGVWQLFFSSAFMGLVVISLFLKFGRGQCLIELTRSMNWKYVFRTLLNICGRCSFLYSIAVIGAIVPTAIGYLRPIFALLLGIFILSESVGWRIGAALFISGFGTALVTGPLVVSHVAAWPIITAFIAPLAWSIYDLVVKKQSEKDSWEKQVFLVFLLISAFSFPAALIDWKPLSFSMILGFLAIGAMYVLLEMTLAKALNRITLALVAPITFIRIIFTAIFAYIFVGEVMSLTTIIGCTLIIGSTLILFIKPAAKQPAVAAAISQKDEDPS